MRRATGTLAVLFVLAIVAALGGCPAAAPPEIQSSSKPISGSLEGTWTASENAGGSVGSMQITIDAANHVTGIHITPPDADMPLAGVSVVQVTDGNVSFSAEFPAGVGGIAFEGTLNTAATTMSGTLTVHTNVGAAAEDTARVVFVRQ